MLLWRFPFLVALLLAQLTWSQQCQPKFLLPSTIQDSITLTVFTPQQSTVLAEYPYNFIPSLFTSKPTALVSISGFELSNFAEINFKISTQIQNNTLLVRLESKNMAWQQVSLSLILHSREDIFAELTSASLTANTRTQLLSIKQSASSAQSLIVVHTILGIQAVYGTSYEFSVDDVQLIAGRGRFSVQANVNCTVSIQTVYFNSLQTNFQYGFSQVKWDPNSANTQYSYVWMEIAPVTYSLIALSKFAFSGQSLSLQTHFDPTNNLLSLKHNQQFTQVEMLFMALGQPGTEICAPCDNFITISGCLDQCPPLTFSSQLARGGKTCRSCLDQLGQTKDPNGQGCLCSENKVYFQGNCYEATQIPLKCSKGQVFINGGCFFRNTSQIIKCPEHAHSNANKTACQCDDGYQSFKESCLELCPQFSSRTSYGLCACKHGYIMNSSHLCESICPQNSVYHPDLDQCKCNSNYMMVNGKCSSCPKGQVFDPTTSKCLAAFYSTAQQGTLLSVCKANEVVVEGKCVCDEWSIKVGDRCVGCPYSTYKLGNQCIQCSSYCANCTSTTCNQCRKGFNLVNGACKEVCGDGRRFVVECDDGNNIDGDGCSAVCTVQQGFLCSGGSPISTDVCQKIDPTAESLTITIEEGYPVYTTSGIITNLIVNPPIPRTQKELLKLFTSITFTPSEGRPKGLILSQSENDPASIRCFFDYHNSLPSLTFVVNFSLKDSNYGSSQLSWIYDTISNSVTSAIRMERYPNRDRLT